MGKSAYRYLKKLLELSNYHEKQVELIAVDSAGHYYTEHGRMGLLRGMPYLESAPERVSYVSNALTVDDSRMVFLKQLSTPITLQSEPGEITLRYFGISQSMTQLNDYLEATRRIRSGENPLGRTIPILAMTANAFLEDMQKSKEAGMDEHLSKPVNISALEQVVKRFRVTPPPKINSGIQCFCRKKPHEFA